jgi:FkbM family methyltransferase
MKRLIVRLADRLGYHIVPHWRADRAPTQWRLQDIFSKLQIDQVIDAGANEGQFYHFLRKEVGFTGQIVSFEPVPELAARLHAQSAADPLWTVHACALGSAAGELTMNVAKASVFSSFLQPVAYDPANDSFEGGNVVVRTERVPVRLLDEVFPDPSALRRTYLKLDTQGFDLEVAKGGQRALGTIPALQTEVSFRPVYDTMPDYKMSLQTFERLGFRVADFFVVTTDSIGIAYEFDCIMIRPADAL